MFVRIVPDRGKTGIRRPDYIGFPAIPNHDAFRFPGFGFDQSEVEYLFVRLVDACIFGQNHTVYMRGQTTIGQFGMLDFTKTIAEDIDIVVSV